MKRVGLVRGLSTPVVYSVSADCSSLNGRLAGLAVVGLVSTLCKLASTRRTSDDTEAQLALEHRYWSRTFLMRLRAIAGACEECKGRSLRVVQVRVVAGAEQSRVVDDLAVLADGAGLSDACAELRRGSEHLKSL